MRSVLAIGATLVALAFAGGAAAQRPAPTPQLPQLSCETRCQIAYNNCIQTQAHGPMSQVMCMQIRSDCIRVCPRRPASFSARPAAQPRLLRTTF